MRSTLKSELFKGSVYKKQYSKDFFTEELIENRIKIDASDVTGVIKELQLNGMFIVMNDIHAPKGYTFDVSNNFSMFVLHFGIGGNYRYTPHESQSPLLEVPDFHYNLFYLPCTNGILEYKGTPGRTFEVLFTVGFIEKLTGDTNSQTLEKVDCAVKEGKPFVFWKKPRPISSELGQVLEEIITCSFVGELKRTYLQSKITALLVDMLIEFNGNIKSEPKIELPKADIACIRRVERHIQSNLNKALSITELSAIAGFNGTKLKRDFKRLNGTTIYKYITQLRMNKASTLIRNEGLPIAQAAYEVGYGNPQHFTNAFKRTMGYLPSELKK